MDLLATPARKRALATVVATLGAASVFMIAATALPLFTYMQPTGASCSFHTMYLVCGDVTTDIGDYPCELMQERMRATLVLNIACIIALGAAAGGMVVGTLQAQASVQVAAAGMASAAWITLVVLWSMTMAWLRGNIIYCNVEYPETLQNYRIGSGVILQIVAWCLTTLAVLALAVIRQTIPWDVPKNYTGELLG